MKTYYIGLFKGSGNCYPLHRNGHKKSTVIVQARSCVDFLSCQLWKYCGERETTKAELRRNKTAILEAINKGNNTNFQSIVID